MVIFLATTLSDWIFILFFIQRTTVVNSTITVISFEYCWPINYTKEIQWNLSNPNPFWDSKPELFSDIACLRIPYQPCIVLFWNFFSGTPASNRHELRLHLNVVPTGAEVFKSTGRHILLHKYVNRIMITYLWRQIQLIIPIRRFRSIECRHFDFFWKYVTWSFFPLRGIVYSIHLIYRYWRILFFLHEELLLLIFK